MTLNAFKKTILILDGAGLLFSGYLSAVKLFTSTCALNEPCPYFLGYPACWYGFGMYLVMFVTALLLLFKRVSVKGAAVTHTVVSALGILFAGSFTIPEIRPLLSGSSHYALGLPTCAYGLIFYITIFIISIRYLRTKK
jgi:hypothetical protein